MTVHISLQSLKVVDNEPRIRDLDLAEALGFSRPRNIRNLIKRNTDELRRHGQLWEMPACGDVSDAEGDSEEEVFSTVEKTSDENRATMARFQENRFAAKRFPGKRGPLGVEYWLNEPQCLLITMFANTDRAEEARSKIIAVFMAWRRGHMPADPAPVFRFAEDAVSVQLLYAKLAAVKEARIVHGHAQARRLWREFGLPEVEPQPLAAAGDSRECLDILMDSRAFDPDCGEPLRDYLHVVMSLEDGAAAMRLTEKGVKPVFEGEQGILVANAGKALDEAYKGTRWRMMRWSYGLRQIPGVRVHPQPVRWGKGADAPQSRATFVPLDVALAGLR